MSEFDPELAVAQTLHGEFFLAHGLATIIGACPDDEIQSFRNRS